MAHLPLKQVKTLYYQKELPVREVGETLGVSMPVVYKFMRKHGLLRRTPQESNRVKFENSPLSFRLKDNLTEQDQQLKIAGLTLYWAEGAKGNQNSRAWTVDFANSDPGMIKVFLRFLREICGVDEKRLRVYLYCHADQKVEKLKDYWNKITKIPLAQFTAPYIREDSEKRNGREMPYGMVHIRYSDKRLLLQIEKWIQEFSLRVGTQAANEITL